MSLKISFHDGDKETRRSKLSKQKPVKLDDQNDHILEEPMTIESPEAHVGGILEDDFGVLASKTMALEALFRLLTSNLIFKDFMREVLLVFTKVVRSEAGSILEMNYKNNTIFFRTAVGHTSDKIVRFVIPMGQGIVGHVAESKQPLVVSDAEGNEFHLKTIAKAVGFDVRNMIALPIMIRGRVFAVLELLNRVGEDTYTEADIELLSNLCEMASRAIEIRLMLASKKTNPEEGGGE